MSVKAVLFDSNEPLLDRAALASHAEAPHVQGRDLADAAEQIVRADA